MRSETAVLCTKLRLKAAFEDRVVTHTCLLEARNAENDYVERKGPEGHSVEKQAKPEPEAPDVQNRRPNDLERPPDGTQGILNLKSIKLNAVCFVRRGGHRVSGYSVSVSRGSRERKAVVHLRGCGHT